MRIDYEELFIEFERNADAAKAHGMSAYMRDQFQFLGINTPLRRSLSKKFLAAAEKLSVVEWDFVRLCWDKPYREYQYLAVNSLSPSIPVTPGGIFN